MVLEVKDLKKYSADYFIHNEAEWTVKPKLQYTSNLMRL